MFYSNEFQDGSMKISLKVFLTGLFAVVMSGFSGASELSDLERPVKIVWEQLPSLPSPAAGQALFFLQDTVYAVGGTTWINGKKVYLDRVLKLDREKACWVESGKLPFALGYAYGVVRDGKMILAGGVLSGNKNSGTLLISGDCGKSWEIRHLDSAPGFGAAYCLDGSCVYASGGFPEADKWQNLSSGLWKLDLDKTDPVWEALLFCPGEPVALSAAAVSGGRFFLAGGANENIVNSRSFRIYGPDGIWHQGRELPAGIRAGVLLSLSDEKLLLFSQCETDQNNDTQATDKIYCYDIAADQWQLTASAPEKAGFDILYRNGEIYLVGGEDKGCSRIGRVYRGVIQK
jgi:N-acetylneuraminic acid mutarotase